MELIGTDCLGDINILIKFKIEDIDSQDIIHNITFWRMRLSRVEGVDGLGRIANDHRAILKSWVELADSQHIEHGVDSGVSILEENGMKKRSPEFYEKFYNENRVTLLQYKSLRVNFDKMIDDILGSDYYNMAMDVYEADRICCEDITKKTNRSILEIVKERIYKIKIKVSY